MEINTRYSTRPDVKTWDAHGGRWTENLGTYVWAYLRPSLRTDFLLGKYDSVERFIKPAACRDGRLAGKCAFRSVQR